METPSTQTGNQTILSPSIFTTAYLIQGQFKAPWRRANIWFLLYFCMVVFTVFFCDFQSLLSCFLLYNTAEASGAQSHKYCSSAVVV